MKNLKNIKKTLLLVSAVAALFSIVACSTVPSQPSGGGKDMAASTVPSQSSDDGKDMADSAVSPPPPGDIESFAAYDEGVPGGVIANKMVINARVTAIDHFNREATLMGSDGKEVTVKVGPEAVNFDKIEKGDMVKVTVAEQLVVFMDETATRIGGSAAVMALGAQAGGMAAQTREIVGTVINIDHEKRTATLEFQDGTFKTFPVRSDIDLSKHKIGEKVVFQLSEMVAIDIQKP